jgi:hypothetical protein
MFFDKFDICSAYYLYGSEYHSGQFSKEYAYMGRALNLGFKPSDSLSYESLSENGKEIYDNLVSQRRNPSPNGGHTGGAASELPSPLNELMQDGPESVFIPEKIDTSIALIVANAQATVSHRRMMGVVLSKTHRPTVVPYSWQ